MVNARENQQRTALMFAAAGGHLTTVQVRSIVSPGFRFSTSFANPKVAQPVLLSKTKLYEIKSIYRSIFLMQLTDNIQSTPCIVSQRKFTCAAQVLIAKGADVDAWENKKGTALMIAAKNGRLLVVEVCIVFRLIKVAET